MMPLHFSASHSSRISKSSRRPTPSLKRSSSSSLRDSPRRKAVQPVHSGTRKLDEEEQDDSFNERLEDVGIVQSLAEDLSLRDVAQTIQHVQSHMFDAMPESGGFNSVRIAEMLNLRKSMPPTVTVAHVHAFLSSPTKTEREISELTKAGIIRRLVIPGRGTGGACIGEGLALEKDIESLLRESKDLDQAVACMCALEDCGTGLIDSLAKFIEILRAKPMAATLPSPLFTPSERIALMRAGFLTSSSQSQDRANVFSRPEAQGSKITTSIPNIARAASGSIEAVGGEGAVHDAGGRGGIRRSSSQADVQHEDDSRIFEALEDLQLCLPGMGSYLRLLNAARSHLVSLVAKSPFKEIPLYLLRERWDGGISADDSAAKAKKYRGEFAGVLPSRTRKWKQYHGLSFSWVLAECLGGGLIELFETGSVGRAARIP